MAWLIARVGRGENDSNRLYASEILAILLQTSDASKRAFALELGGMEALLQAVARYRKANPGDAEEEEYLENVFDALCASAMLPEGKGELLKAEAIDLMVIMMKKRPLARLPAMKFCNFALTDSAPACEQFVASLGLGPLFGFFMGKGLDKGAGKKAKGKKKMKRDQAGEMQEHVVSIVTNLLHKVPLASKSRNRVLSKFAEQECEKLDRLVELWSEYSEKIGPAADSLEPSLGEEAEEQYLELLGSGLYVLQQLALVIAYLWASGDPAVQKRLVFVMHQYGHTLREVSEVLQRQFLFVYEGQEGAKEDEEKERLKGLIEIITKSLSD